MVRCRSPKKQIRKAKGKSKAMKEPPSSRDLGGLIRKPSFTSKNVKDNSEETFWNSQTVLVIPTGQNPRGMNDVGTLWVAEIKDIRANGKMHWIRVKWLYSEAHLLEVGATSMPTSGLATLELCKSDHCDWIDSRCIEDSIEVPLLDFSSHQKWIEPGQFFHRHVFNATKGYLRVFGAPNCCGTHNPDSQLLRLCANKHMSHDECLQRKQARLANNVPILSDPPPGVPSLLWNIAKSAMVSGVLNGVDYGVDGLLTARLRAAECLKSYSPGTRWEECVGEKEVKYFEQNTHLTGIPIRYECPTEGCPYAL